MHFGNLPDVSCEVVFGYATCSHGTSTRPSAFALIGKSMSGSYSGSINSSSKKHIIVFTNMNLKFLKDTPPTMSTSANFGIGKVLLVDRNSFGYMVRHSYQIDRWQFSDLEDG